MQSVSSLFKGILLAFFLAFMLLAVTGCDSWPPSAYPQYYSIDHHSYGSGKPQTGTFAFRAQTEAYDAARKINSGK